MTDGHRGLLIEADLTVELPESTLRFHTEAGTLYVEAPDFAALDELRATADGDAIERLRALGVEGPLAVETPVLVRVRGVPVARYDPSRAAGWLAARLGIGPFRIDLPGVLQAAARRRWP